MSLGEGTRKSRRLDSNSKKSPEKRDTLTTTDGEERVQLGECINTNTQQKPNPDSLHNQSSPDRESEAISHPCSLHSQSDNETPTDYNACAGPHRQLELDPDVFTMDMDSDEETTSVDDVKPLIQKEQNQQENSSSVQRKNMNTDVRKKSGKLKSSQKSKCDQHDDNVSHKNETSQSCGSPLVREDILFLSQSDLKEQAVPSVETEFKNSEDQKEEFSLDFEMVPKPQSAMSFSMENSVVNMNEADEDSDPFEFIEE